MWTDVQWTRLFGLSGFIFWEPYSFDNEMRREYEEKRANLPVFPNVPAWVFPIVWFTIKACLVASLVLYIDFTSNFDDWSWTTVMALAFSNLALAKSWTFFYRVRYYGIALAVCVVLFLSGLAILICMGLGRDNAGSLWYVPLVLFCPYVAWLLVACLLSYSIMRASATPASVLPQQQVQAALSKKLSTIKGH